LINPYANSLPIASRFLALHAVACQCMPVGPVAGKLPNKGCQTDDEPSVDPL
jgi:hypothetical protein